MNINFHNINIIQISFNNNFINVINNFIFEIYKTFENFANNNNNNNNNNTEKQINYIIMNIIFIEIFVIENKNNEFMKNINNILIFFKYF